MGVLKSIYFSARFFAFAGFITFLFLLAYVFPLLFAVAQLVLLLALVVLCFDAYQLYAKGRRMIATRLCAERFSNGDDNIVQIVIENHFPIATTVRLIDEIPFQFQRRDINFKAALSAHENKIVEYMLRPVQRGIYQFGNIRVFVKSHIGLIIRRFDQGKELKVDVYPSYLQLHQYELMAIHHRLEDLGIKKVRKIGHNIEFEHIREYVVGDDFRTINWKATARKNDLMVNLYQDEKSQQVYAVIDKGRMMKMPFEGLSLLDYAINSALVISNIAIKKGDMAGLITFDKTFDSYLPAGKRSNQMHDILGHLYNQTTTFGESDFSTIYVQVKRRIRRRSLMLLYTNFESIHSLDRQLPFLRKLSQTHLLVVIFFENTELDSLVNSKPENTPGLYQKVIAAQFAFEKKQIVKTLHRHGIQTVLTRPSELSVQVINKYIELKARQLI